jgi:hypothetical protein
MQNFWPAKSVCARLSSPFPTARNELPSQIKLEQQGDPIMLASLSMFGVMLITLTIL